MPSRLLTYCVAGTLGALSAAHVTWTFSSWPFPDQERFAEAVTGVAAEDAPSTPMTLGVAALLAQAAILVARCGAQAPSRPPGRVVVLGTQVVGGVLLARSAAGFVISGARLIATPKAFRRLDLTVYSPLCLALGAGATTIASSARKARR